MAAAYAPPPVGPHHPPGSVAPAVDRPGTPSTASSPSSREPHALSLKVMRISRPSLAAVDRPFFEHQPASVSPGTWGGTKVGEFGAALTDAAKEDPLVNENESFAEAERGPADRRVGPSTLRDFGISEMLVLPSSFGTINLGETFSSYLCVNNETQESVNAATLRIEMQTNTTKVLLAQVSAPSSSSPISSDIDAATGGEKVVLGPNGTMETTVSHEIKELGMHVLICTVSYRTTDPYGETKGGVERSFRKFYKFNVPVCPLSVKSKVHPPRSPTSLFSSDPKDRERVLLEVQVQNVGLKPQWFEGFEFEPAEGWEWKALGMEGQAAENSGRGDKTEFPEAIELWSGTMELLGPEDIRQYLFILTPKSSQPLHPPPPLQAIPTNVSGQGARSAPLPTTVSLPLGRLDIVWRTSMGELGRLQTSQLMRRKTIVPPLIVSLGQPEQPRPVYHHNLPYQPREPPAPNRVASLAGRGRPATPPAIDASRSFVGAASDMALPPPILEVELMTPSVPHGSTKVEEPFKINYALWVRDLSMLNLGDDDKGKEGYVIGDSEAAASSGTASLPSKNKERKRVRWLRLAIQQVSHRPPDDFASDSAYTPGSQATGRDSRTGTELVSSPSIALTRKASVTSVLSRKASMASIGSTRTGVSSFTSSIDGPGVSGSVGAAPTGYGLRRSVSTRSQHRVQAGLASAIAVSTPSSINSSSTARSLPQKPLGSRPPNLPPVGLASPSGVAFATPPTTAALHGMVSLSPTSRASLERARDGASTPPPPSLPPKGLGPMSPQSATDEAHPLKTAFESPPRESVGPLNSGLPPRRSHPPTLPPPFFHHYPSTTARLVPSSTDELLPLGPSVVFLPPLRLSAKRWPHPDAIEAKSEARESVVEADGGEEAEAEVVFSAEYLPLEKGLLRVGGVRVLLLGWEDEVDGDHMTQTFDEGGEEGVEGSSEVAKTTTGGEAEVKGAGVNFDEARPVREWEVVAEVWVGGPRRPT